MNIEQIIFWVLVLSAIVWLFENAVIPIRMDRPRILYSSLRYPEAYDEVTKVLRLFYHELGRWSVVFSDAEDGRIQARMSFREDYGEPFNQTFERQIVLDLFLNPTDDMGTELSLNYDVYSEYDRSTCNQLIESTTRRIRLALDANPYMA